MIVTAVHCPALAKVYVSHKLFWLNRYLDDAGWVLGDYNTFYHLGKDSIKDLLEDYIFNEQPESQNLPELHWDIKYLSWEAFKGLYQ